MRRVMISLLLFVFALPALAQTTDAGPRDVDITAPDGAKLRATYYPAAKPGANGSPAVLLLHMCNTTRKSWEPVARQLRAAGIHALTLDYRGFGESSGDLFDKMSPQDAQKMATEKWPGDVDAAFDFLLAQPGVNKSYIGAGGGSCGVNQAVQLARRHPNVISLVLLAGPANKEGLDFLQQNHFPPIFAAASADDQFDNDAPHSMQWLAEIAGNPRNKFVSFPDGKHGTEIFGPHPELPEQIVAWYVDTLVKAPANPKTPVAAKKTPRTEFWALASSPQTITQAVQMFHDARTRDPHVFLFPEFMLNQLGYQHLQAGHNQEAIALFKLNTEAFPTSANTYDSLSDAYLAAGQNDAALVAEQKCLELLPNDKINEQFKAGLRQAAEQKLAKLKGNSEK